MVECSIISWLLYPSSSSKSGFTLRKVNFEFKMISSLLIMWMKGLSINKKSNAHLKQVAPEKAAKWSSAMFGMYPLSKEPKDPSLPVTLHLSMSAWLTSPSYLSHCQVRTGASDNCFLYRAGVHKLIHAPGQNQFRLASLTNNSKTLNIYRIFVEVRKIITYSVNIWSSKKSCQN